MLQGAYKTHRASKQQWWCGTYHWSSHWWHREWHLLATPSQAWRLLPFSCGVILAGLAPLCFDWSHWQKTLSFTKPSQRWSLYNIIIIKKLNYGENMVKTNHLFVESRMGRNRYYWVRKWPVMWIDSSVHTDHKIQTMRNLNIWDYHFSAVPKW